MNKNKTLHLLKEFAGQKKKLYIVSIILAIFGVICGIVPYMILGNMIQNIMMGNKNFSIYVTSLILIALFWIAKEIFHSFSTAYSHIATFNVLGNMRKAALDKLSKVPLGYVKDTQSGTLKNVIVERIDSIETTLAHILPEFTSNLLAPVIMFILLLTIDWRMALISVITLPISLMLLFGMMIGYEEKYRNVINKTKILNDTAVEYINGIEVIKAFGRAKTSYEKFATAAQEGASCYVEWMRSSNIFFSAIMTIAPCTLISTLPIGAYFVYNGSLSISDFVMCIILSVGLIAPLITVMSYSDDMARVDTIVGEVDEILSQPELIRPKEDKKSINQYSIQLKDVYFAYHDTEVLHGINMEIEEGSVNAIVGPSGSGKSTIAKLIASLWDVTSGSICIGGVNIKDLSLENYNRMIAYVSQDNFLFDESIKENIRMGNLNASDEEIYNVARNCGCYDFIENLENGFDTIVGSAGGHLSGGERQRISIARAMLKNAPIIILDEATAYTDPENEALVQNSIAKLVQGRTLIVVAHRLSTIKNSDKIFVVEDGRIKAIGKHQNLVENCTLYREMWESHISIKDNNKGGSENA